MTNNPEKNTTFLRVISIELFAARCVYTLTFCFLTMCVCVCVCVCMILLGCVFDEVNWNWSNKRQKKNEYI